MTYTTVYWDEETKSQKERDCTPEEIAEIEQRKAENTAAARFPKEKEVYLADVRDMRERVLNRLAGIAAAAIAVGDQATIDAFVIARQSLLDLTKDPMVEAATTIEQLSIACKAAYAQIVMACPLNLKQAILTVDE